MKCGKVVCGLLILFVVALPGRAPAMSEEGMDFDFELNLRWPVSEEPGAPLEKMTGVNFMEFTASTPLGGLPAWQWEWLAPDGELAARSRTMFVSADPGFSVQVQETEILRAVRGPTGAFGRPHFAAPAVKVHGSYNRALNFRENAFSPPSKRPTATMGPVILYRDDLEVIVISSLDNFLSAIVAPVGGEWWCGFHGEVEEVPAGTVHRVLIVQGRGINAALLKWGEVLRAWHGHQPLPNDADVGLKYLGYWTDNGAYYYYKTAPGMNYHDTLLAVKRDADQRGIPYRYFQIDSWWYPKARIKNPLNGFRGGTLVWEPIPELFPRGLPAFQAELGLPLIAHNRWYNRESPYCRRYECAYGVGDKNAALPIDPAFWDEIMDKAIAYGVEVYEQDWLHTQLYMIPWLRSGIKNAESWFDAMIRAAHARGLTVQLCMASPGFFLQQVKHPNVTQVRTSGDYHAGAPKTIYWDDFHIVSLFAEAVGLWPFKDNFQSSFGQRPVRNELWPFEETLISILSAGLVGPGDKIGHADPELLMKTCRRDGLLLKPDRPATPIDLMFLDNHKPWIVTTESNHRLGKTVYLAAFNLRPYKMLDPEVSLADLGLAGNYAIYNYRSKALELNRTRINFGFMRLNRAAYYVLAPLIEDRFALIGETSKFVTASAKRFTRAEYADGRLRLELAGVPGEKVKFAIFSRFPPSRTVGALQVNIEPGRSGLYEFELKIPDSGKAAVTIEI